MGVKKNGMKIMSGSLKTHWIQYVTEMNMKINPVCIKSVSTGNMLLQLLSSINSKHIQPGFVWKHEVGNEETKYKTPSILHLKFVNGYEKQYHMGMSSFQMIQHEIN